MGCCTSGRLDGADLEIAFQGADLTIREKKPTFDSEGFADVSLSSHRDSDIAKADSQPTFLMHKGLVRGRHLSSGVDLEDLEVGVQSLITPRFGGETDRKVSSISLLDFEPTESKSLAGNSRLTLE